jgi:hypothetical protein
MENDAIDILEHDLNRHSQPYRLRSGVLQIRNKSKAPGQLDKDDNPRRGVRLGGMLGQKPSAHNAPPGDFMRLPLKRLALWTHRLGRKLTDRAAIGALLEQ